MATKILDIAASPLEAAADPSSEAVSVPKRQGFNAQETRYMQGEKEPVTSSVLISNSKYLNSPLYREAWMQTSLRRIGHDLAPTYHIPMMARGLADITDHAEYYRLIEAEKAKNPAFAAWLAERRLTRYVADEMTGYADGTLGASIREFLRKPGFEMEFVNKDVEPRNDIEYLIKRVGANHDIDHLVTGFGPNTAGEEALALCNVTATSRFLTPDLARLISQATVFVSAAGYKRTAIHYPAVLPTFLDAMQQGINAGLAIRMPLFMVQWEEYLDWQIVDIANDLGITRGPEECWDWTSEACSG